MKVFFYDDTYIRQLVEFLRLVWNKDMTEAIFLERRKQDTVGNPCAKKGGFPIAIAVKNDRILGHHAGTPTQVWANGKTFLSHWLAGLHVLPEGRRQGIAKALQNVTNQLPLATSFWVIEATLRVKKRLGWTIVGKIPEYVKILDPQKLTESINYSELTQFRPNFKKTIQRAFANKKGTSSLLVQSALKIQNRIFESFLSKRTIQHKIHLVQDFDSRVDQLWDRNKDGIKFAQVRKSGYLNWQFKHENGWIKIIAENGPDVIGYAILCLKEIQKGKNIRGIRVLSIIDIFWDFSKPETCWDLLRYIEHMGFEKNATVLICSINEKTTRQILIQNGYFRIPGTVYFGFHCNIPGLHLSPLMKDWFITRGDADAAGSLGP